MNYIMKWSIGGGDDLLVREFERQNNIELPEDYRDFLIKHNGGFPLLKGCYVKDPGLPVIVDVLFGITGKRNTDIQARLEAAGDELPEGFILIGRDPGGSCFILDTKSTGNIHFWDSMQTFEESSDEKNTYYVAATFSEFMIGLSNSPGGISVSD